MIQHVVFIVCLGSVFSAEMLNTAIEHIMDFYTPEIHPEVKIIKDLGAAGVWMWGGAFFIMEGIYICHALLK
jgi:diacylglycerol kinase